MVIVVLFGATYIYWKKIQGVEIKSTKWRYQHTVYHLVMTFSNAPAHNLTEFRMS